MPDSTTKQALTNMVTQLNKKAKQVFLSVIEQMQDGYLKLNNNKLYMPLTVEITNPLQLSFWGNGKLISFCHYYEQNGDLMQDPEVLFLVVDNRNGEAENLDMFGVWPVFFQQANLSIYREYMRFNNGKTYVHAKGQKDCSIFCNQWMLNIKDQQNINL